MGINSKLAIFLLLGSLNLISIEADASEDPENLVNYVNILQGTESTSGFSHGNTLPLVGMPWGMVNWSIQNEKGRWFFHPNGKINGFRATHQPSPWIGDYGQFVLMPQLGDLQMDPIARTVDYDAIAAVLHPDYEKLDLNKNTITAELVGTERCGVFRLNYHESKTGRLIINTFGHGEIKMDGRTIYGISHASSGGVDKATFASYFVIQLDRDITKSGGGSGAVPISPVPNVTPTLSGKSTAPTHAENEGYVEFNTDSNNPVVIRIGTSFISWQQAEQNLRAETEGSFQEVHDRVLAAWNANLGKIEIEADDANKKTFYSCLYRAQMFPHRLYELDKEGKPIHYSPYDGKIHGGVLYGDVGIWDGFRTTFPFLSLVYPERLAEILQGFVNASQEGNGTIPEWPSPGYRSCMFGQHSASIFADAMVKGFTGFDAAKAYDALRKGALQGDGRGGGSDYIKLGHLISAHDKYGAVSTTLDYAYDDWCVAQMARELKHPEDEKALLATAQNYRKLWDSTVGFMREKKEDGTWEEPFDEFKWMGPYCESGPWQASWFVPHDPAGLLGLVGGREQFSEKLDKLFSLSVPEGHKMLIHEEREMAAITFGQCALNNQPSFDIPYLYAAIGEPWKTQYWTRRACSDLFNSGPKGFCGDEDNGSLSSWYLFSALGFYPFCPGTTQYLITSPMFTKTTLQLADGKKLVIEAPENNEKNIYVQSRTFSGVADTRTWISHQNLVKGGVLHFVMGPSPVRTVLTGADLPYSVSSEK